MQSLIAHRRVKNKSKLNQFYDFQNDRRCSRGELSLIDRWNLTFNHSVDAEMSLEVIRIKRFKDGGVLIDQLSEIIQEYIKMSKNISVYSEFGRKRRMGCLIFDQRSRLNTWVWIATVKSCPLDHRWSAQMKPHDRVKLNRRITHAVQSSLYVCDVFTCPQKSIGCVKSQPL